MSIASDRTAEILATLPEPTEELERDPADYGRDVLCIETLKSGRYMRDRPLIAAGLYHRLVTDPGSLPGWSEDDRDFGLGIERYVGRVDAAEGLGTEIEIELSKDPRVSSVAAAVTEHRFPDGGARLDIAVTAESTAGVLRFKVSVDNVSARFLGLEAA